MVGEKLDGMGMGEYMFGRTLPRLTFLSLFSPSTPFGLDLRRFSLGQ